MTGGGVFSSGVFPAGIFPAGIFPKTVTALEPEICYPLTVSFREDITSIEIGQGDSKAVDMIISGAGTGLDLTLADVTFVMKLCYGSTRYEIPCRKGSIYQGSLIPASAGGITIPMTGTHTAVTGVYFGELKVSFSRGQKTAPTTSYITIRIKEAL